MSWEKGIFLSFLCVLSKRSLLSPEWNEHSWSILCRLKMNFLEISWVGEMKRPMALADAMFACRWIHQLAGEKEVRLERNGKTYNYCGVELVRSDALWAACRKLWKSKNRRLKPHVDSFESERTDVWYRMSKALKEIEKVFWSHILKALIWNMKETEMTFEAAFRRLWDRKDVWPSHCWADERL